MSSFKKRWDCWACAGIPNFERLKICKRNSLRKRVRHPDPDARKKEWGSILWGDLGEKPPAGATKSRKSTRAKTGHCKKQQELKPQGHSP